MSLMAEIEEIGYFLAINPLRQNSITKMRLNHGLIRDISINLQLHGPEIKKRRFTSSTALKNMAQRFGSGSKTEHTFTSVAIRPTWQKMSIVL